MVTRFRAGQVLSLLLWAWTSAPASADFVTYTTGTFSAAEWSSHIYPGSTGSSTASTETTGGNPGAYRRVSLSVAPNEYVQNNQLWSVAEFTPATQGPVTSASLSYDISRVYTTNVGATQVAEGIAVQQDGVIYTYLLGVSTASPPTWETITVSNLVPLFSSVNWTTGNTIQFGFYDSVGTTTTGFTIDGGYDNYSVTVNFAPALSAVPAPSSLWLATSAIALLGGAGLWRKWSARSAFGAAAGATRLCGTR